jgi:hypothetical protein
MSALGIFIVSKKKIDITACSVFSQMDDAEGYNSKPSEPSHDYVIKIFNSYVEEFAPIMNKAFDYVPVFGVISYDHTFNVQKRITLLNKPLEPEYLPTGGPPPRDRHVAVAEDSCLYITSATGVVSYSYYLLCSSSSSNPQKSEDLVRLNHHISLWLKFVKLRVDLLLLKRVNDFLLVMMKFGIIS